MDKTFKPYNFKEGEFPHALGAIRTELYRVGRIYGRYPLDSKSEGIIECEQIMKELIEAEKILSKIKWKLLNRN